MFLRNNSAGLVCHARSTWQASVYAAKVFDDGSGPVVLPGDEERAVAVHRVERLLIEEPHQAVRVQPACGNGPRTSAMHKINAPVTLTQCQGSGERSVLPAADLLSSSALNHFAKPALVLSSTVRSGADSARFISMLDCCRTAINHASRRSCDCEPPPWHACFEHDMTRGATIRCRAHRQGPTYCKRFLREGGVQIREGQCRGFGSSRKGTSLTDAAKHTTTKRHGGIFTRRRPTHSRAHRYTRGAHRAHAGGS